MQPVMNMFSSADGVRRKWKKESRREMRGERQGADAPTLNSSPLATSLLFSFFLVLSAVVRHFQQEHVHRLHV